MKKINVLVAIFLILGSVVVLYLFRQEAKELWLKIKPPKTSKTPSMIKALPFREKEKPRYKERSLLLSSLKENQILLEDIVFTPKRAPRKTFFQCSVVISVSSKEEAQKLKTLKPYLIDLIVEAGNDFPYRDIITPDGRLLFKQKLLQALNQKLDSSIKDLWLVDYQIGRMRRL